MYTEHQRAVLDKVWGLADSEGSMAKAAKLLGISSTTLSMIRNNKYNADVSSIIAKIEAYFGVKETLAATYREQEYVETSISSQVYDIITVCQVKGGLAIAAGDAGIGKTKACRRYIEDNPTNAVLITVNPCYTTVKSMLRILADKLGVQAERSKDEMWAAIVSKLSDGMVLIFDEAQHLALRTIEVLRSFSDYFSDRGQTLGICFVGNTDTVGKIGSKKAEFAQIVNRTKQTVIYSSRQIRREDIGKLFPLIASKDKELDFLLAIARSPQAIRGAVNVFSNAYDNGDYSYPGLVAIAKFMNIQI